MIVPSAYRAGYDKARALDPELATRYVRHTVIGDPVADAAIEALAPFNVADAHRFIHAGMERDASVLAGAPRAFRDFFADIDDPPAWFDPDSVLPGRRAFHENSDLLIPAFFVVTVQNAATPVAKAFYTTGRVRTEHGLRRIRQNIRHFVEIMLPGSLRRHGDGWKLSVRIRLVHAQVRRLIRESGQWDESVHGTPLSAAHMGLSSANFSATMLRQAQRLGARLDADACASFMQIWRYASWLIGTPEDLLFEGDQAATHELARITTLCEPPPGHESAAIANALVEALPEIAGRTEPAARKAMMMHVYRISRALLGDELADQLEFPRMRTTGLLALLRGMRKVQWAARRVAPEFAGLLRGGSFEFLLEASMLDDLTYRIPDHLDAELATPW